MKKFSLKYKLVAFVLIMSFTFQSMETINSHTYTTGVDTLHHHYVMSCFGFNSNPVHMNFNCPY